ncbi:MAG: putative short-chain dehydrogenase/reductase [Acidimicrobiales bacterium]|nr:MAG: putative short-chain dehydrogenase/reductase [Acidimicrobiales bacterium]
MGTLDGRVMIITGAARGMGREHALLCAAEGAHVVVNDLGCGADGQGVDPTLAAAVVEEIEASGGVAIANTDDVATMGGAANLVQQAVDVFGDVHVLVNNAGVLRDRMFVNMSEDDWDVAIRGHLKSVFCPTRAASERWRTRSKAGDQVAASVISMSSTSGLLGAVGQSNYGAAKAGIAALTVILAEELGRYGVRVNALTPVARTRMTEGAPGIADMVRVPEDPSAFDIYHPGNVAPFVAWLATEACPVTGEVYYVKGGQVGQYSGWEYTTVLERDARWNVAELAAAMAAPDHSS